MIVVELYTKGRQWNRFYLPKEVREEYGISEGQYIHYRIVKIDGSSLKEPIDITAKVQRNYLVRIPKPIPEDFGIRPGSTLEIEIVRTAKPEVV
jgi:AbrB family looped-hinge helix DNA binding protein